MRRTRRRNDVSWVVVWGVITAAPILGCGGEEDPRHLQAVSGTVNLDGKPLKEGMIQFQPTGSNVATAGAGGIVDGSYSVAKSAGLAPGSYVVMITSTPAPNPPANGMPGDPVAPPKETIPAEYNAKSTLIREVTEAGPNTFDFDLQSKPKSK